MGQSGSSLGTRAFLWTKTNSIVDLNDLVPGLPAGMILTGAFSINNKGEIAAFGVINPKLNKNHQANMDDHIHSGPTHVFLLTPLPISTASAGSVDAIGFSRCLHIESAFLCDRCTSSDLPVEPLLAPL